MRGLQLQIGNRVSHYPLFSVAVLHGRTLVLFETQSMTRARVWPIYSLASRSGERLITSRNVQARVQKLNT